MYKIYQVKIGDTLETIANKHNTDIATLRQINGNLNNLMPGQNIVVPQTENEMYETYIVQNGDSMYSIAKKYGINVNDLLELNGINQNDYIYPNQMILIPKQNRTVYITKPNDTIQSVITKLQITPEILLRQNEEILLLPDQALFYSKEGNM